MHFVYAIVITCPELTDPDNGMIDCSLGPDGIPTEGDTCAYSCDDGTWTGSEPTCARCKKTIINVCIYLFILQYTSVCVKMNYKIHEASVNIIVCFQFLSIMSTTNCS